MAREAALTAIDEYNRRRRSARLTEELGTFHDFVSPRELDALRSQD